MTDIARRRVLVVDDELLIRWSLNEALVDAGFEVVEGSNAAEAQRAMTDASHLPDVVLLDYRLPDSNDLGLLTAIRAAAPRVPVIMMTAHKTPDLVDAALALGAHRVVGKPFEVHEMVTLVADALGTR